MHCDAGVGGTARPLFRKADQTCAYTLPTAVFHDRHLTKLQRAVAQRAQLHASDHFATQNSAEMMFLCIIADVLSAERQAQRRAQNRLAQDEVLPVQRRTELRADE